MTQFLSYKESCFVISRIHGMIGFSFPKAAGHQKGSYDRSSLHVPWCSITQLTYYLCLLFTQKRAQICRRGCTDGLETGFEIHKNVYTIVNRPLPRHGRGGPHENIARNAPLALIRHPSRALRAVFDELPLAVEIRAG